MNDDTRFVNKTNQFNLTTKRYSVDDIKGMTGDIFTVHSSDKFGENGLIGVVIVKEDVGDASIDSFLMLCRVMGRKIEDVIIQCISNFYRKSNCRKLTATYICTQKNKPMEGLYDKLGFETISERHIT